MSLLAGGGGGGGGGGQGGGLCVFSCAAVLSGFGAVAALYDFDIGAESAFFALTGLGGLCFAKCQYLRVARERNKYHHRREFDAGSNWNGVGAEASAGNYAQAGGMMPGNPTRKRREIDHEKAEDEAGNAYSFLKSLQTQQVKSDMTSGIPLLKMLG